MSSLSFKIKYFLIFKRLFTCILKAREVITAGMLWCVGDGKSIKINADRWLPGTSPLNYFSTGGHGRRMDSFSTVGFRYRWLESPSS